jgi:hypothetical protein
MERMPLVGVPGQVGRFRPEQIVQQSTWNRVPNEAQNIALMHTIRCVREAATTVTTVNPLDPIDDYYEHSDCGCEHTHPIGRMP